VHDAPFTLPGSVVKLKSLTHNLRGHDSNRESSTSVSSLQAKDLTFLRLIQNRGHARDSQIEPVTGDVSSFSETIEASTAIEGTDTHSNVISSADLDSNDQGVFDFISSQVRLLLFYLISKGHCSDSSFVFLKSFDKETGTKESDGDLDKVTQGSGAATIESLYPEFLIEGMNKFKNELIEDQLLPYLNRTLPSLMELPEKAFEAIGNPWEFITSALGGVAAIFADDQGVDILLNMIKSVATENEMISQSGMNQCFPSNDGDVPDFLTSRILNQKSEGKSKMMNAICSNVNIENSELLAGSVGISILGGIRALNNIGGVANVDIGKMLLSVFDYLKLSYVLILNIFVYIIDIGYEQYFNSDPTFHTIGKLFLGPSISFESINECTAGKYKRSDTGICTICPKVLTVFHFCLKQGAMFV
jgi:hypothetical protein